MKTVWSLARKHAAPIQLVLDFVLALVIGIYGSKATMASRPSPVGHPLQFFIDAGNLNWLLVAGLLVVFMKHQLSRNVSTEARKDFIRKLLEGIVRALALSRTDSPGPAHPDAPAEPQSEEVEIRAACHLYDKKKDALVPYCTWGFQWNKDFDSTVPCNHKDSNKFVIVRAYKDRDVQCQNVGHSEVFDMPVPVWPELKCVLAAAIRDYNDPQCQPLGTINFDSNRTLEELHFEGKRAKEICRIYAASIYDLLKD